MGSTSHAAHIVVDDPDIHALGRLALEDLMDLIPHGAQADNKVFNKDEMLGAFQGGEHIGEHVVAQGIVLDLGVGKDRVVPLAADRPGRQGAPGIVLFQAFRRFGFLGQQRMDAGRRPVQLAPQPEGRALVAPQQIEDAALHRHEQEQRHPADLELRLNGVHADEQQAHHHTEGNAQAVDPGDVVGQAQKQKRHPHRLTEDQQTRQHQAAEHRTVNPFENTVDLAQEVLLSPLCPVGPGTGFPASGGAANNIPTVSLWGENCKTASKMPPPPLRQKAFPARPPQDRQPVPSFRRFNAGEIVPPHPHGWAEQSFPAIVGQKQVVKSTESPCLPGFAKIIFQNFCVIYIVKSFCFYFISTLVLRLLIFHSLFIHYS